MVHFWVNPSVEAGVPPAWHSDSQPTRLPLQLTALWSRKQNTPFTFRLYETPGDATFLS
jgi:hypothetical protein